MLAPETLLQNRYRIVRQIGQGGIGAVYEAIDERLDNTIAVKQILRSGEELRQAFEREARLLANLRHPALPKVMDHFVEGAGQFLVMEFVPGADLAQMLAYRPEPFELDQVLNWADQLLNALAYLHDQQPPIVHRDIKPHNLKVMDNGEIILLDFGLAKGFPGQVDVASSMAGYTLVYAPPEQIREQGTDARSDLYSLAATLYDLMTGVKPVSALNRIMAESSGKPDPLPPAHEVNSAVPVSVSLALVKAMALDQEQRFTSAEEMRAVLQADARKGARILTADESTPSMPKPPLATPNNLPAQLTPLIGREREVDAVAQRLRREGIRLMTLIGPGGVGKTRLSLQVAATLLSFFKDGIFFVGLAPIRDPSLLLSTIGHTLGIGEVGARSLLESTISYLHEKEMLLILDNFEQVVTAAPLVTELLAACPRLKILVTSREVLHLQGEHEFPVPPLTLPERGQVPPVQRLSQYEAVALFIQRATAIRPGFTISNENAPAVAEICYRLDGLPLAIELAAARIKLFSPQALLERLGDRFKVLQSGARDVPDRQRTLRAAIDWSYNLLTPAEQMLFRRLAVFVGGRTLEAVEAVCDPAGDDEVTLLRIDVLDGLTSLVDKSLIRQVGGAGGEPRFTMLATIHEYAAERLAESAEVEALRRRHAAYFLALAKQAEPELTRAGQVIWLNRLEMEHDNLRAALQWAEDSHEAEISLRLSTMLWRFWEVRGYLSEGRGWLESALSESYDAPARLRANAFNAAGNLARNQGDYLQATKFHQESLVLRRELRDKWGIASSLNNLGNVARNQRDYERAVTLYTESLALYTEVGDTWDKALLLNNLGLIKVDQGLYAEAAPLLQESLALFRQLRDKWGSTLALNNLGLTAYYQGNYGEAIRLHEEALALRQELGDKLGIASSLHNLGNAVGEKGEYRRAMTLYREGLALCRELGYKPGIVMYIEGMASLAATQNQMEQAVCLFGAAGALRKVIGAPLSAAEEADDARYIAMARDALDDETFAAAWTRGQAMSLEESIAYALEEK